MTRKNKATFNIHFSQPIDGAKEGTVTIYPEGIFEVRPKHKRREYSLPLSFVAEMVCWRIAKSDANLNKKK